MRQLSACPICESRAFRHVYTGRTTRNPDDPNRWKLSRCSDCDHGFLNPQPQWDDLGGYYDANYQAYDPSHGIQDDIESTIRRVRATGEYRHVAIRSGLRILDVGSGGGSFLRVVKTLGAHARGVEPSPIAAERARGLGLDVVTGTLDEYAAANPGDRYDLITFSHVVEHLPDPVGTLAVATRLLAPSGTIWVAVPNGACRFARQLGWRWHSTDLPLHLQHFSPQSMRVAAERAGLLVKGFRTYSLPKAVRSSILQEWRFRWKVPIRIAQRILGDGHVNRCADQLDREMVGEAILAEFGVGEAR